MLNLLKNRLPQALSVRGISYNIDYYHSTALAILDLLRDTLWTAEERATKALEMFFYENIPPEREEAFTAMIWFLNGGEDDLGEDDHKAKDSEKVLDMEEDGNLIYSAFFRVYNVDLEEHPLHWWKFKVMLEDLGETTALQNILRIRTIKMDDVPETKRSQVRALKKKFSLGKDAQPVRETLEERNARWLKE